jgi:ribonuclease HI
MFFDGSLMKTGAGAGLLFISPLGKHLHYVLRLHFPVSNNEAEYEALVNGLRIAIELGVRRLDARGDSQLVIVQVMKNSHCRDPKMEAYCDEVRRLEDKFYGLELNHVARRYNETADELAKIASGRTTVPRTSSPETYINPQSRPMTRPSPRRPRPSPRHPRPPRVRHCASRKSGVGSRLIETGRPHTYNISTEESYPSTEPKLGDWCGAPSRLSCWETGRSFTTAAPQASSSDAYPSLKARSFYKRYTRGLAVTTQCLGPLLETPSDKVSTGRPRWPTPLELSALPRVPILREADPPARSGSTDDTHHLAICCVGSGPRWSLAEGTRGLHAPAGRHRQILQVDRGPAPKQHQVRTDGGILHQHHPSLRGPELHHHRQRHPVHQQKIPGLL